MNDFNYDNEIIEIESDNEIKNNELTETIVNDYKIETPKRKKTIKDKWYELSKKKRTIIIISAILIFLIILAITIYLTFFKKEKVELPQEEEIILLKDNYRYENGKLIFLDKNDRTIGEYSCKNVDPNKCYVMKLNYENDDFERIISVNETGEEIEKNSLIYLDKYVFISDGNESNLYNFKDKKNELKVNRIKTYGTEKNLVVVEDEDGKYGLIELTLDGVEYLIRPSYNNLGIINSKLVYLVALDKDKTYIINSDGKKISSNITGVIKSLNEDYIVVEKNKTYNLYDYEYTELLNNYDYINLSSDIVSLVKNKHLFLRDLSLNKLNEDGIRLDNTDYVKKYVYDNENKLKETKKSYEIVVKDNYAMITIGNDIKNINLNEGIVNSKYNYINYFDGKLYFYEDENKENLLGTYVCNNKNDIKDSNSTLNKCILFNINDKISGIYNENYVIIDDNYDNNSEKKYYIYSLKEKKIKGTYSYLEVINTNELNETIKHINSNSSYFIAVTDTGKNKGNYGVIEITNEKVSGKVPFDYQSINKENEYYIMKNSNGKLSLFDNKFAKLSKEFDYIKLYDKYYVGINDNKLNVYTYSSNKELLTNSLEVNDINYSINFEDGIKITINDILHKYDIEGNEIIDNTEVPDED